METVFIAHLMIVSFATVVWNVLLVSIKIHSQSYKISQDSIIR